MASKKRVMTERRLANDLSGVWWDPRFETHEASWDAVARRVVELYGRLPKPAKPAKPRRRAK